jgi:transcription antitermination factor NusG
LVPNAKLELVQEVKLTFLHNLFDYVGTKKFSNCCPGCGGTSYKMDWDAIAGAKYEVLKLNGDKFDFVATTNDPTYTFTNLSVGNDNWFTVRAIDIATGVVSEESRGINRTIAKLF